MDKARIKRFYLLLCFLFYLLGFFHGKNIYGEIVVHLLESRLRIIHVIKINNEKIKTHIKLIEDRLKD